MKVGIELVGNTGAAPPKLEPSDNPEGFCPDCLDFKIAGLYAFVADAAGSPPESMTYHHSARRQLLNFKLIHYPPAAP